jgi:hypothetical protein
MKKLLVSLLIIPFAILILGDLVLAQFSPTYNEQTVSVTSATTPQKVLGSGCVTWYIRPRTGAAVALLCWHYSGTTVPAAIPTACSTPTSTPAAGCTEVAVGATFGDNNVVSTQPPTQQSLACVLETGVTADTVDTVCR